MPFIGIHLDVKENELEIDADNLRQAMLCPRDSHLIFILVGGFCTNHLQGPFAIIIVFEFAIKADVFAAAKDPAKL